MKLISTLCLVAMAVAGQQAARAAAFSNGNFEAPGIADGTQAPISPGSEPSGWQAGGTATPNDFNIFYENDAYGVDGVDGPNIVGFGGDDTTGASLSQTFDTVAGLSYTVSFYVTAQQGSGDQSVLASVSNGAVVLASSADTIPGYDGGIDNFLWTKESFDFIATGSSSTLTFLDTSDAAASGGVNWGLDAVSVTSASSVPEPGSLATLLAGVGVVMAARRRQRRAPGA